MFATIFLLAAIVLASPFSIPLDEGGSSLASQSDNGICLMICGAQELKCGASSYSRKMGDCWTCCSSPNNGDIAGDDGPNTLVLKSPDPTTNVESKAISNKNSVVLQEVCSRICSATPLYCPQGWLNRKLGECYACCKPNSVTAGDDKQNNG